MTQTTSRSNSGSTVLNPGLQEKLENDELDWDDPGHRAAFLKHWINRPILQEEGGPARCPTHGNGCR